MTWRAHNEAGAATFNVRRQRGVWLVIRDGAFYRDYPVRESALTAARTAASLPLTRSVAAEILVCDDDV